MGMYSVNGLNQVDDSLTQTDKAADAKVTGDEIAALKAGTSLANGSITEAKLANAIKPEAVNARMQGIDNLMNMANARVIFEDCNLVVGDNNVGYAAAQGMCAIDDTHIAIAYIEYTYTTPGNTETLAATDNAKLKVIDLTDGSYRENILPLGHANSLAYNPVDNVIYCTPSEFPSRAPANIVIVIDYDTLTISDTITVDFTAPGAVAYDRENDEIVIRETDTLKIYDSSFSLLRTVALQEQAGTNQGMDVSNGYLISPKAFTLTSNSDGIKGTKGNIIQIHRLSDGALYANINIPTVIDNLHVDESEEICIFPNGTAALLFVNPAISNMRTASVVGIGVPLGDRVDSNMLRRYYYVDSTSTGLGFGSATHPFKTIHQLRNRDLTNTYTYFISLDDTTEFSVFDAVNFVFNFKQNCIVNAPALVLENCNAELVAGTNFNTEYASRITLKGRSIINLGIKAYDVRCYQAIVRFSQNVSNFVYLTEGAIGRTWSNAITFGELRIRHGGVMFLGDATYTTLTIADNGTLIEPGKLTEPETGTAPPSEGTYARGDIIWNTSPSAGGTLCWVCVVAGTPGTWAAVPIGS